jgi:adenylate cyclase
MVWAKRAVVFVDVVESVRLVEQDETGTIGRWLAFVDHVRESILPQRNGRVVKSLGDGMLLDFDDVRSAAAAAMAIQDASRRANAGIAPERQIHLRIGIEVSDVIVEPDDVHGHGVNRAARLMTLAGPGEIIVSDHARDQLTDDLDASIEDLGERFVRHIQQPVRAYRIGPPGLSGALRSSAPVDDLVPTIAVLPFAARQVSAEQDMLGDVLAEEIIHALSRTSAMSVISRLSTSAFRARHATLAEISSFLNANYVLSGSYASDGQRVTLDAELAEARTGRIVWSERLRDNLSGILSGEPELIGRIVSDVSNAIVMRELERARSQPLPTLNTYSLLLAAIALMHRLSSSVFEQAHRLLQAIIERGVNHPVPYAWLAHWHVMRAQQGWSADPRRDAQMALDCTKRALDIDSRCSHALAIDGLVHTHFLKRPDTAQESYDLAVQANPNNGLAWLLKGTQHAFLDEGQLAVDCTQRAISLSPLDPHKYYYDSLAATACISARQYDRALELAQRSLRANCQHTSTLRVIVCAQWHLGQHETARETARRLMRAEPNLTVSGWLARSPAAGHQMGEDFAQVMRRVGVPE